jgi:hypothetical protein
MFTSSSAAEYKTRCMTMPLQLWHCQAADVLQYGTLQNVSHSVSQLPNHLTESELSPGLMTPHSDRMMADAAVLEAGYREKGSSGFLARLTGKEAV